MRFINGIKSYVLENELKITILENKINILNYSDIGHFDESKIVIKTKFKDIVVKGSNLVISKLMKDEVLITGNFTNIELR